MKTTEFCKTNDSPTQKALTAATEYIATVRTMSRNADGRFRRERFDQLSGMNAGLTGTAAVADRLAIAMHSVKDAPKVDIARRTSLRRTFVDCSQPMIDVNAPCPCELDEQVIVRFGSHRPGAGVY